MIKERIQQKGEDLKMLQGHDRLAYLIDIAKDVEQLPDEVKTNENKIRGCASNLWLICLLYTSPSPRDSLSSRMPSSA